MTFQPPPPPPGGNPPPPPPPPPPGQWGPPPGGGYPAPRGGFDPKNVNALDWAIIGAGFLAFIFSFLDYYTASYGPFSGSENAWHGFFGWFAMLLALAGAAVVAMELFAPQVKMPWPNRVVGLGLFALATLCVILALFVSPIDVPSGSGVDTGNGVGYWLSLIVIIAGLVLSLMRAQQTGTALPGPLANMPNIGAKGSQGGIGGQGGQGGGYGQGGQGGGYGQGGPPPPPPPPPGYGQPPTG